MAAALVAVSSAAFAQDSAHDSLPDGARQARMDQAYGDHRSGTVRGDLHEAGHAIHDGVRATGHAIHRGVRATGHAIRSGVRATGHAVHHGANATGRAVRRTVDGNASPQPGATSTRAHP